MKPSIIITFLCCFALTVSSCKKEKKTVVCVNHHLSPLDSACNMGRTSVWDGYYSYLNTWMYPSRPDTAFYYTDTMTLIVLDNKTLFFGVFIGSGYAYLDTLRYYATDDSTIIYVAGAGSTVTADMVYYYKRDSIVYNYEDLSETYTERVNLWTQ